jgi:hypothetical protein
MSELVQTILSESGRYKAEIERRPGGSFQVTVYRWTEEWVPGYGKVGEFWERVSDMVTLADTPERAEELAREDLRAGESLRG